MPSNPPCATCHARTKVVCIGCDERPEDCICADDGYDDLDDPSLLINIL